MLHTRSRTKQSNKMESSTSDIQRKNKKNRHQQQLYRDFVIARPLFCVFPCRLLECRGHTFFFVVALWKTVIASTDGGQAKERMEGAGSRRLAMSSRLVVSFPTLSFFNSTGQKKTLLRLWVLCCCLFVFFFYVCLCFEWWGIVLKKAKLPVVRMSHDFTLLTF